MLVELSLKEKRKVRLLGKSNNIIKSNNMVGEGAYRIYIFYYGLIQYIGVGLLLENVKRIVDYACMYIYIYIHLRVFTNE